MDRNNFWVTLIALLGITLCCTGYMVVALGMSGLAAFLSAIWFDYRWLFIGAGGLSLAIAVFFLRKRSAPPGK